MKTAIVHLKSAAPICFSRFHSTPFLDKEGHDAHDMRTWREKAHYDKKGKAFIPGKAFKFALAAAAKRMSKPIKGKGKKTYTACFAAGIVILENLPLEVTRDEIEGVDVYVNADGVRGSGKRVIKRFPIVHSWAGTIAVQILDETITEDVFKETFVFAGQFVGVGQNRPENQGEHGRFDVLDICWK